jgi:hypothetical protein
MCGLEGDPEGIGGRAQRTWKMRKRFPRFHHGRHTKFVEVCILQPDSVVSKNPSFVVLSKCMGSVKKIQAACVFVAEVRRHADNMPFGDFHCADASAEKDS